MISSLLKRTWSDKGLLLGIAIPILAINAWCSYRILGLVSQQAVIKEDYAEANSIRNGLLSVDVWKTHVQRITSQRIDRLKLSQAQQDMIREAIETALKALIAETERLMKKPQKSLKGKVKKIAFNVLVDTKELTQQTPQYADAIFQEVKKPENLKKLKSLALSQIKDASLAQEKGERSLQRLLRKYHTTTGDAFNIRVKSLIMEFRDAVHGYTAIMLGSLMFFLMVWALLWKRPDLYAPLYASSVGLAFVLLVSGLALPMIDIDARISNFDFLLLGEHLQFKDQMLFYRSKSILQMVDVMMFSGKFDTAFVGFLILLFSVIFPAFKLSSTLLCVFGGDRLRHNSVVKYFAYQSGKWSMADVMVVAIFIAYIGFNGVLSGQIKSLNFRSESVAVIATNETSLQPGFLLFLSFVLFGLILAEILKKVSKERDRSTAARPSQGSPVASGLSPRMGVLPRTSTGSFRTVDKTPSHLN